ncbi:PAS domain-containing protein [Hymenobacter sp.]|jgi:PAS domain S-box-containing protein|uniref:PAS domain-containing protein n=1 Tax=Hymenobacter sp. TaxID=1898978 RepID=UPI002ED9C326
MPDSTALQPDLYSPADLLETLLDISLTGIALLRPVYAAAGAELVDLAYVRLNPPAQRLLQLPEYPANTFLVLQSDAQAKSLFDFYRKAFETSEASQFTFQQPHPETGNLLHIAAKRSGQVLVVNLTETPCLNGHLAQPTLPQGKEAVLLAVFEALPAPYLLLSPKLIIEEASEAYLAATLTQRDNLIGQHLFEAFPDNPETPEAKGVQNLSESLELARTTGQPHEMALQHYDVPDPDNPGRFVERYWLPRNTPVLDAQGHLRCFIHAVANVTDQVQAERQLHDSQARERVAQAAVAREREVLQAVIRQAPVGIALFEGENQLIAAANNQICAMWGYSISEVLGKPLLEAVPELRGQDFAEVIAEVARTRVPFVGSEVPVQLTQQGALETHYFNFVYQPLYGPDGSLLGVLDIVSDITEQVRNRQQVERLNEELQTANEEYLASNAELIEIQQQLQQARAEADRQRQQLHSIFMQAPAMVCIFRGPEHVFQLVNPLYQQRVGDRPLLGRPVAEAMPELASQPIVGLLDEVYRTGESFEAHEMLVQLDHNNSGALGENYYNFIYQATRSLEGAIDGILVFAYEVTTQVLARRGIERNEAQLQRLNQQLESANQAFMTAAQTAEAAQAEAEAQRQRLAAILEELPASIATFQGPNHEYHLINPHYQQLFPGRVLQGRSFREAMPELEGQQFFELFDRVYQSGEPFSGHEIETWVDSTNTGQLEQRYYNTFLQALRDTDGTINGILNFAYDVTEQVQTRRQVEQGRQQVEVLNQELAAANEELFTANEEVRANVAELQLTEQALLELNIDLENRVLARTREVQQARVETERQRARLERFFMQAPAAICILDGPELVFELVNPNYQALFPGRELQGRAILEAMPEIAGHRVHETLQHVYRTGETHQEPGLLIAFQRSENGVLEDRYFNYIQQARYNENGQIDGILVFAFEVTTQVQDQQRADALQAEVLAGVQRIAQERETFYQVFEQTPAAICIQRGPEHRYEYFNAAYQEFFPGRELLGRTVAEALPETVGAGFKGLLDEVYATGQTYFGNEAQLLLEQSDGQPPREMYFTFTYQAYRENGVIVGISTFAYEVSEQVQARQQREAQQEQLRAMFEQAPVGIGVFQGPDYLVEVANPTLCTMLGQPSPQLLGRPLFEVVPRTIMQGIQEQLDKVRLTGKSVVAQEVPVQLNHRITYETGYFNLAYEPLRDEQGNITSVTVVANEVSEQVLARQQVEQSQGQVQDLNQELAAINEELHATNEELSDTNTQLIRTNVDLDNFIYTASHDLRAPIANIEGLLHALTHQLPEASTADGQVRPILQMMQGSVERFQKTIDHLTDVTKLQKEQAQPSQTVDLAAIIEEVRLDLAPLLESTQAQLEVEVDQCPTVSFSQKNLRSVVYNLLSNALKYRHPSRLPHVRLRCQQTEGFAALEVQDNGLGLDAAQQVRLFGMFQRLHDHVEGTGIGLYMVKRMVENAGGHIQVESQPGVGSTFTVSFPH